MNPAALLAMFAPMLLVTPDFAPDSTEWNGLAYLATTADEANVEVQVLDTLSWDAVQPRDILVLLNPGPSVSGDTLRSFVEDGGHAILALDGPDGGHLAKGLGITVSAPPAIHGSYYQNHVDFPVLTPDSDHFLWFNVDRIVLNHPTVLATQENEVPGFSWKNIIAFEEPGQFFAQEAAVGRGRLLVLADASVFINDMQIQSHGTKQFTANSMRYFCGGEASVRCRIFLILPSTQTVGQYRPMDSRGGTTLETFFERAVNELNQLGIRTNGALSSKDSLKYLGWGLVLFLLLMALGWMLRSSPPIGDWMATREPSGSALGERIDGWLSTPKNADYSPALLAIQVDICQTLGAFLETDVTRESWSREGVKEVTDAVGHRASPELASALLRCLQNSNMVSNVSAKASRPSSTTRASFRQLLADWRQVRDALNPRGDA